MKTHHKEKTAAVILAAGAGKRMGKPKGLLRLEGDSLVGFLANRLLRLGLEPIVAVMSEQIHDEISGDLPQEVKTVINRETEKGQLHSIRIGITAVADFSQPGTEKASTGNEIALPADVKGVMIQPVDHPFVSDKTYQRLADHAGPGSIVIPTCSGRRGHPPIFGRQTLRYMYEIPLSDGARAIYGLVPEKLLEIETGDRGIILNINTPDDWERGLKNWETKMQISDNKANTQSEDPEAADGS